MLRTITKSVDINGSNSHVRFNHGTIIQTRIACKKIPCYICESAYRWFIVKKAKIF